MAAIAKQKLEERGMHEASRRIVERLSKELVPIDVTAEQFWIKLGHNRHDKKESIISEVGNESDIVAVVEKIVSKPVVGFIAKKMERNKEKGEK